MLRLSKIAQTGEKVNNMPEKIKIEKLDRAKTYDFWPVIEKINSIIDVLGNAGIIEAVELPGKK